MVDLAMAAELAMGPEQLSDIRVSARLLLILNTLLELLEPSKCVVLSECSFTSSCSCQQSPLTHHEQRSP